MPRQAAAVRFVHVTTNLPDPRFWFRGPWSQVQVLAGAGAGGGAGACIGAPRVAGHNAVELTLRLCTAKGTAGRKFEQQPRPLPQLRRVAYETLVAERKYNAVFVR